MVELNRMTADELEALLRKVNHRLVALDYDVKRNSAECSRVQRSLAVMHRRITAQLAAMR